ncbi:MAG: tetratricopeptide repeat protein, partial [Chloroflexota bacterium]|nr:tetratricopeptide repeat protein [Chloroflexota bacterium]
MTEALAPRFVARGLANGMALEDYGTHCRFARERLKAGDATGGAAAARRATELAPRGMEAQRLLGVALLELGEARPALTAFQAALAGEPLDVVAQAGVAQAQERLGGVASAEPEWLCTWELQPGLAPVERRLQAAREAAGATPTDGEPQPLTSAALARIYLRGGLFEHAVAEARSALSRQPDRRDLNLTLAEAFWRSGDGATAAAVAQDLLERLPDCVAANLLLATHWQTVGRDPSPLLARVRAADPDGRVAIRLFGDRASPPPLEGEEGVPAALPSSTAMVVEPQPMATAPPEPVAIQLPSYQSVSAPDVAAPVPDLTAERAAAPGNASAAAAPALAASPRTARPEQDAGDEPMSAGVSTAVTPDDVHSAAARARVSPEVHLPEVSPEEIHPQQEIHPQLELEVPHSPQPTTDLVPTYIAAAPQIIEAPPAISEPQVTLAPPAVAVPQVTLAPQVVAGLQRVASPGAASASEIAAAAA